MCNEWIKMKHLKYSTFPSGQRAPFGSSTDCESVQQHPGGASFTQLRCGWLLISFIVT